MPHVLAINCGSSSLKFALFELNDALHEGDQPRALARGTIGGLPQTAVFRLAAGAGAPAHAIEATNHGEAARYLLQWLDSSRLLANDQRLIVGHRVVHGGDEFTRPTAVSAEMLDRLDAFTALAPLHNGPAIEVIRALRKDLGARALHVASFDTAFHRSMPPRARYYAVSPDLLPEGRARRFGFHGLAHRSMLGAVAVARGQALTELRLVTLQLGSGCSAATIEGGRSVDSSMGLTPLEGLMMATRSGDVDPGLVTLVAEATGRPADEVLAELNERSGLLGVSGLSSDLRELIEAKARGNERAALAIEMFCYRVRKQVGAYLAALGGADAIVFGGGIGENMPDVRRRVCEGLEWCGVRLDTAANERASGTARVSTSRSAIEVWVATVDEESLIARDALEVATSASMA